MRARVWIAAALLTLTAAGSVRSQAPSPARVEAPIEEVRLSDGVSRFGVRMTVGGQSVLAGIDTGAAGLRIMPDVAAGMTVTPSEQAESYAFGSGAHLTGVAGRTKIAIGALSGEVDAHLVRQVDCLPGRAGCPGRLGLGYGFLGDGLPGEGFRVLLGGNMGPTSIDNVFQAIGARRWILEVPRPGEGKGRLILNPTAEEMAGYRFASLAGGYAEKDGGGLHDAVIGCLKAVRDGRRVCGLTTFDTGAFVIRLLNIPAGPGHWPNGEALEFEIVKADRSTIVSMPITVGAQAQAIGYGTAPVRQPVLQMGAAPYYAFSILYDPSGRRLGFKPR